MRRHILPILAAAGIVAAANASADAATSTATVNVAVSALASATIGATYSSGSNVLCDVGTTVVGLVACASTVTLAGNIRTTVADTGGASVTLTGASIAGTGANAIAPTALRMTCTGGTTAGATYPGTAGTLAAATPLSTSAVTCQSWTGTVVDSYSLVAALEIDASKVPADTYTLTGFTATATAN